MRHTTMSSSSSSIPSTLRGGRSSTAHVTGQPPTLSYAYLDSDTLKPAEVFLQHRLSSSSQSGIQVPYYL
jgi:hypothetical protein